MGGTRAYLELSHLEEETLGCEVAGHFPSVCALQFLGLASHPIFGTDMFVPKVPGEALCPREVRPSSPSSRCLRCELAVRDGSLASWVPLGVVD